jgi:hypothetical protein
MMQRETSICANFANLNNSKYRYKACHPSCRCHAFKCESHDAARRLTISLSTAFKQISSRSNPGREARSDEDVDNSRRRTRAAPAETALVVDLRSPEEIRASKDGLPIPSDSDA